MNVVMIVPTGIGCEIGGHAGLIMCWKANVHPDTVRRPVIGLTIK